jgi:hypothetical protein
MSGGLPSSREFKKEIHVRESLDLSPRNPSIQFHVPSTSQPQFQDPFRGQTQFQESPKMNQFVDTAVINEVPAYRLPPSTQSQYIYETPSLMNKRGSRRDSLRRESHSSLDLQRTLSVTIEQALASIETFRTNTMEELSSIPSTIQFNVPATADEQKALSTCVGRLEDILINVEKVALPTESLEDRLTVRKARQELVALIITALDKIEGFIQPKTPSTVTSLSPTVVPTTGIPEESDDEDDESYEEIERNILETLSRKKPEVRRSVTVEDVPDSEY